MSASTSSNSKYCRCCLTLENLRSLEKPQLYRGKMENYRKMLTKCFAIEILLEENWICGSCVNRLRACCSFRRCIVSAKKYLEKHLNENPIDGNVISLTNDTLDPRIHGPLILNNHKTFRGKPNEADAFGTFDVDKYENDYKDWKGDIVDIDAEHESSKTKDRFSKTKCSLSNNHQSSSNQKNNPLGHVKESTAESSTLLEKTSNGDDDFNFGDDAEPSDGSESVSDDDDSFFNSVDNPKSVKDSTDPDANDPKLVPYVINSTDRVCEICHEEFSFYKDLLQHMHRHFPNHICDVCGKVCSTHRSLLSHSLVHKDVRYSCAECDKTFKSRASLKKHVMVKHRGEKIFFKCNVCKEKLPTYNEKLKHLTEKHGRVDKMYKCLQCSVKYRLGGQLRAHMRKVHLQEKNHTCVVCGAAFFRKTCLTKHMVKHTGQSNYTCNVCNKYYARKDTLRQHMKSHCMEKKDYMMGPMQQMDSRY